MKINKYLLFLPLFANLIACSIALGVLLLFTAERLDSQYRDQSRLLAEAAMRSLRWGAEKAAFDHAQAGGATDRALQAFDDSQLARQFSKSRLQEMQLGAVAILAGQNRVLFQSGLSARAEEELRKDSTLFDLLANSARSSGPHAHSAFTQLDGDLLVAAAAAVGRAAAGGDFNQPVIVFFRILDAQALGELSANYPLKDLALRRDPPAAKAPHLPIADLIGTRLSHLVWRSDAPGQAFLSFSGWPILGIFLALMAGSFAIGLRIDQVMRWLSRANRDLSVKNEELAALAEERDRQRRLAEGAMAERAALIAGMSHDLRPPLAAIIGFSDILKNEMFGPLGSTSYLRYSADINENGQHLLMLIDQLVDLAKIENRTFGLYPEPVRLDDSLDEAVARFAGRIGGRSLMRDLGTGEIVADRRLISRIFVNLLGRALDRTEAAGKIRIEARIEADRLMLTVADDGPPSDGAEGLALDLSRKLVVLAGGDLEVADSGRSVLLRHPLGAAAPQNREAIP